MHCARYRAAPNSEWAAKFVGTFQVIGVTYTIALYCFHTRDNVRHLRDKDTLTEEDVLTTLSNITKLITDQISRPVYPVLGNHDYYPSHRVAGLTAGGMYAKIAEIWKPFLDPIGAMTSFTEGERLKSCHLVEPGRRIIGRKGIPDNSVHIDVTFYSQMC